MCVCVCFAGGRRNAVGQQRVDLDLATPLASRCQCPSGPLSHRPQALGWPSSGLSQADLGVGPGRSPGSPRQCARD
eukprot:8252082-Alexandrium_andersonii.AAC.1